MTTRRTTAADVASAMRQCGFLTHEELAAMLVNLSALVKSKASGLNHQCALGVIDALDEMADSIDADAAAQAEQVTA